MRKLFHGISKMWGVSAEQGRYRSGAEMSEVEAFTSAWMLVDDGVIVGLGGDEGVYGEDVVAMGDAMDLERIDLGGVEVLPGLVDSHTHIVFAAPRHEEFEMRIRGESYEAIAAAGGGILNSARKLQAMDEDELYVQAAERLRTMIAHGTTTVEIKSGYGLTTDSELKILRVVKRLKQDFDIVIKATFLGAHGIPMEYKGEPDRYVDLVIEDMLPKVVAEGLADHIDVFCDRGFFTMEQTDRILKAAAVLGLPSKIHANELGLTGGVQVAVANGSWSADHLEHCSEVEIGLLRESMDMGYGGTVPVGLPGTSYFLGIPYAPGRALIGAGLPFAMATDFNPGSSPIASLQVVWALGCTQQKLLPAEGFYAVTCNAARALRCEKKLARWPQASAPTSSPPKPSMPLKPFLTSWDRITVTKCSSTENYFSKTRLIELHGFAPNSIFTFGHGESMWYGKPLGPKAGYHSPSVFAWQDGSTR